MVLWAIVGLLVVALIVGGTWLLTHQTPAPTTPPLNIPTASTTVTVSPSYKDNGNYRDPSGQVTGTADVNRQELRVGDCILNISDTGDTIDTLTVVPCSTPHEAEVYGVGASVTNTTDALEQFCDGEFATYVGVIWDDSILDMTYIHYRNGSTTDVQCILYQEGKMVTKTYKGSKM